TMHTPCRFNLLWLMVLAAVQCEFMLQAQTPLVESLDMFSHQNSFYGAVRQRVHMSDSECETEFRNR
ncbi:MAG: hypothetical protein ACKPKO_42090, partial [Candidatus Fonsibacter sp.]